MLGPFVFDHGSDPSIPQLVHASHHAGGVFLSLLVAFMGCCAAFYMAPPPHPTATQSHRHRVSLWCASMVLGLGIWAMHFIDMLAMHLPTSVGYAPLETAASIIPGIVTAWLALLVLQKQQPSHTRILLSGAMLGLGIVAMHYCGIAALEIDGRMVFHMPLFLLSALLGLVFATLSLMAHHWMNRQDMANPPWYWRLLPPVLMTMAIASMHYLAMHAMRIELNDVQGPLQAPLPQSNDHPMLSFVLAAMAGVVCLVLALMHALLRYRDLWQAVAARDARLHAMIETADVGFVSIDAKGLIQDFNPSAQHIFGYAKEEVIGRNIAMLMPSPLAEQHDGHLEHHGGKPHAPVLGGAREVLGKHKDGKHMPLQLAIGKAITPAGVIFVGYFQDMSLRKRTDAQLRIAASVFQHVLEGVAIVDANHNISDVNPAFLRLMQLDKEHCVGRPLAQLYEDTDLPPDMSKLWRTVATQKYWQSEIMCTRTNGKVWIQRLSISPVFNELQRPHHFIAVISDVSERQGLEVTQPHADLHDSATGLPTQKLFIDRLMNTLQTARYKSSHVGVVVVQALPIPSPSIQPRTTDIDGALRLLAQLLQQQLRATDTLSRLSDNQLALLLPGIKDASTLAALVQRLWQAIQNPALGYAQYGIQRLQLGHASTLSAKVMAQELLDEALVIQQTWTPDTTRVH